MWLALVQVDDRMSVARLAFLGIIVQVTSAALLAAVFYTLKRHTRGRPYVREWSAAWIALTVAIAALFVRYALAEGWMPLVFDRDYWTRSEFGVGALYSVYQFSKLAFFGLLLSGAVAFARESAAPRRRWMTLAAIAVAIATVVASDGLNRVVVWQSPFAVASTAGAAWLLLRVPTGRASIGTRVMATTLIVLALIWSGYVWSFFSEGNPASHFPRLLATLREYNSFIDVLMQTILALAMIITIFLDLEREAEAARAERQRMQERLAQSQKLESLGGVVSGVAHELNNPLTAILGFTEELRRLHPEGDAGEFIRVIHEQAERCRAIVRDLLTFARSRAVERVEVDAGELVARVARGFDPELRRHALDFELETDAALPRVFAEPAALEQIFANLIANAIHASPDGARIRVSARPAADNAEFWIEDEGPGVPRELRDRIFEPFFTTKAPGQGTGLGLSVTHGIVAAHGGTIRCDDRADGRPGARFIVVLPVHAPAAARKASAPPRREDGPPLRGVGPPPEGAAGGARPLRVLIADDEESVRRLLVRRVTQKGWEAFEAATGRAALQQIADHRDLDVVVTDLKMPDQSGFDVFDWLFANDPALVERSIAITGDAQSHEVVQFATRMRCTIFEKPLDLDVMVARIEALAGTRGIATAQPTRTV